MSSDANKNNPLHGVTLKMMVEKLSEHYGWEVLGTYINIDCFLRNPSVKSSLNFLRNTNHAWARKKVETLYLETNFDLKND